MMTLSLVPPLFYYFFQAIDSETNNSLSYKFLYDPPFYAKMIRFPTTHHPVNFTIEICGKNQKFSLLVKAL